MKLEKITHIGSRGIMFTYEYGDSVYLINCFNKLVLCDTSEGIEEMEYVKTYLKENNLEKKALFIFNSHSDYDHVWGNEFFENENIIASDECLYRMKERGELDLEIFSNQNTKLKYPNITFSNKLKFIDEEIEFIYAPGHTICSAICFDKLDNVLYVGDLLEKPIPVLSYIDLSCYIKTLELIKNLNVKYLITTHSEIVDNDLINQHIQYLNDVIMGKYLTFTNEFMPIRHAYNLKNLLLLEYDELFKAKLKANFNYKTYKEDLWEFICCKQNLYNKQVWDIRELSYEDLQYLLKEYYGRKFNC